MAKSKETPATESNAGKEFFKPQVKGETVTGKFIKFVHTILVDTNTKEKKDSVSIELDTAFVGMSAAIQTAIRPFYKTIKPGDTLTVTYAGEKLSAAKRKVKVYEVILNGEVISGYQTATAEQVDSFFNNAE